MHPRDCGNKLGFGRIIACLLLISGLHPGCRRPAGPEALITVAQVDAHVKFLASDELEGRRPGSPGIRAAEDYIARQFREAGLGEFPDFPDYRHEFSYSRRTRRKPGATSQEISLTNVIGYLEGDDTRFREEFVVFCAHHDHIGILGSTEDNIYNGAEDNASGTTAVIALAQYFGRAGGHRRSLIFVTFTAEEMGMVGSRRLVRDLPVPKERIIAAINFEMIGKPSAAGEPECYLTGWSRSDLGPIMQAALAGRPPRLTPGPEQAERYYFASDNISFAREGIVAHTLAGIGSVHDPLAHHYDDEYETLDVPCMTQNIRGVVHATRTLLSGERTPIWRDEDGRPQDQHGTSPRK